MRLLFDQNLSYKLPGHLADEFPDSTQARLCGLDTADDHTLWRYALDHGLTIVTLDADFADLAFALGSPPKIVWLRCGNQPTAVVAQLIRHHADAIRQLDNSEDVHCLEIR